MVSPTNLMLCAVLSAATVISAAAPVSAAPASGLAGQLERSSRGASTFEQVQYRRQYDGRYNRYSGKAFCGSDTAVR